MDRGCLRSGGKGQVLGRGASAGTCVVEPAAMSTPSPGTPVPSWDTRRDALFVVFVWLIATLVNVGKAAHVDDAAHLAIAEHILRDPLHPMSGTVFWGEHPQPIHELNQPHLIFYVIALGLWLGGGSLVVPQLLLSLFVLPGIAAFHALARRFFADDRERSWLATVLVFLGPGFLPGQNLMCDAALVSLLCIALWAWATGRLWAAGVAIGVACLVKYTALALVPIFLLDAYVHREPRRAAFVLVPLAFLAAYAGLNLADYGGVHVLERHPGGVGDFGPLARVGITVARAALFVLTLGAISFVPLLRRPTRRVGIGVAVAFAALLVGTRVVAAVGPAEMRDEPWSVSILRTLFFLSGIVSIAVTVRGTDRGSALDRTLAGTALSIALFVVVLSPFVAVRHALLVLPPVVLLGLRTASPWSRPLAVGVGTLTLLIGLAVSAGDREQAATYREAAQRYRERCATSGTTYFAGHWGWQWYAGRSGMTAYDPGVSILRPGDHLIRPRLVDSPPLAPSDIACLESESTDEIPAGTTAFLRTMTSRQGYYAVWQGLPYGPSDEPLESFTVQRVTCFAAPPD